MWQKLLDKVDESSISNSVRFFGGFFDNFCLDYENLVDFSWLWIKLIAQNKTQFQYNRRKTEKGKDVVKCYVCTYIIIIQVINPMYVCDTAPRKEKLIHEYMFSFSRSWERGFNFGMSDLVICLFVYVFVSLFVFLIRVFLVPFWTGGKGGLHWH